MTGKPLISFIARSIFIGLIVAGLLLLLLPDLRTQNTLSSGWFSSSSPSQNRESFFDAISRSAPAVVNIYSVSIEQDDGLFRRQPRERASLGSGVIMTDNGYIMTCFHVVNGADSILVALQDSSVLEAQIVGSDPLTDLAVIKVTADDLHVIPQLDETDIRVGDVVMAIGNPYDLGQTITQGIVSRAGRFSGLANYTDFIQTDAVLNQGNSGGALVDSNGYLVGITNANFQIRDGRKRVRNVDGIGFAVPYELANRIMNDIITNGKVIRGYLGFEGAAYNNRTGIVVSEVVSNSPAEKAGLQPQDLIISIDGIPIESATKTLNRIAESAPGTAIALEVSRDGETIFLEAIVGQVI